MDIDEVVDCDMAKLRQIADAIREALMCVRTVGPTAHAYVAGEDWEDFLARLQDLVPDVSAEAEARLRALIEDKARAGEIV
jgi:uncharacterized protein YPO0396